MSDPEPSTASIEMEAYRLLEQARLLNRDKRDAFLDDNCHRDEIRRLVNQMLSAGDAEFLERSPKLRRFSAGDVLAERYVVKRLLGSGGMGEVYEVFDRMLQEDIALKAVHTWIAADEQGRERYIREARIAKKLSHRNLCRVYDAFTIETRPSSPPLLVLSMELLRGETLSAVLRRCGAMPCPDASTILRQVCNALASLHENGVVHRDLKASNILLTHAEGATVRAVVTDFGLARSRDDSRLTRVGQVVGTLYSMAPEQALGDFSVASDIWAVGVLMYEMMVGRAPFQGPLGRSEIVEATLKSESRGYRSSWISAVCKCLSLDSRERYQTTQELLSDLFGDEVRIKRRSLFWLGSLALIAILLTGLAAWRFWPNSVPPSPTVSITEKGKTSAVPSISETKTAAPPQIKPKLLASRYSLRFRVTVESPESNESIVRVGEGTQRFKFEALPSQSWIILRANEDQAPGPMHVGVDARGMSPGTYSGSVQLLSEQATGSPKNINIVMEVTEN